MKHIALITLSLVFVAQVAFAQDKQPLHHEVYDGWESVENPAISPSGTWAQFEVHPQEGDGTLHVVNLETDVRHVVARATEARLSEMTETVVFRIRPPHDSLKQAERDDVPEDERPRDTLAVLDLNTGEVTHLGPIESFAVPKENPVYVAYRLPAEQDDEAEDEETESEDDENDESEEKEERTPGTPLLLRDLATGTETRFEDAHLFAFSEPGNRLAFTTATADSSGDGLFVVSTEAPEVQTLLTGKGEYKQPVFDKAGTQLAVLTNRDDIEADEPDYALYTWQEGMDAAEVLAHSETEGVPEDAVVSPHREPYFSDSGDHLFFGTGPRPEPEPEEETPEDEKIELDIWSWTDSELQPMQLVEREDELKRSYLAVAHMEERRIVQLGSPEIPEVQVHTKSTAEVVVGLSEEPYRKLVSWEWPSYRDAYLIDLETGDAERAVEKTQGFPSLSPEGRYLAWYAPQDSAWMAMDTAEQITVNLTETVPHPVYDELNDRPMPAYAYGSAGWTEGDETFLIYDRHDIWSTDPTGTHPARSITEEMGRTENLRFRYVNLDPEEEAIPASTDLLLSAFDRETKATGFYRDQVEGSTAPEPLVMTEHYYSTPIKAEEAERVLFRRESFTESPDLWATTLAFEDLEQLSTLNPQQEEYSWGTVELVEWRSLDGIPLQGLLYKPEGFDPEQQYPTMVYFYERSSDGLHQYHAPRPARSSINYSFYASRGYVVFVPDIPYKVGYPGESALAAVVPGVLSLIDKGFVDPDRIGVQGHSWGGYQIAYMITRTNIFRAAEAGAPVSNMTSAYGGIRWASGMSRMFQYEQTQSRIGGSLWEYPMRYLDNSPIFYADRVETPLLMMHNDDDGAVPWYQGIEYFVALRRLNKPVWMLNYNGEQHGLTERKNQKDWAVRMQQFFDHYLMDAPAPEWMNDGVPAVRKGQTLGLELVDDQEEK